MDFDDYINSIYEPRVDGSYIRGYISKFTDYDTVADIMYKANKYKLEEEHSFMNEAFEKFEAIREKEGILSAGIFLHEQYKFLQVERAKANLLNK